MQALQQELWAIEGERTHTHVGDLAWWTTQHVGREPEWKRQLWLEGDRCVAWAWLDLPGKLDYEVHADHRGGALHEDVLDWFEAEAEDDVLHAWVMEGDAVSLELLTRRGFARPDGHASFVYYVRNIEPDPDFATDCCKVRDGYSLRTVRGEEDLRERVEVHRATWAPSRVTDASYRNVMRTWPYREDLDCVVEAAGGTFAAYVLCWYDEANRVGEFEPVGTHPEHRRRGLAAAVCRYGLARLHDVGATKAIVYAGGRDEDAPARALYESLGFRAHTRMLQVRRAP